MELRELQEQCQADSARYFPSPTFTATEYWAVALAGEVGEFCNVLKKRLRGDLLEEDFWEAAESELPDILIYLLETASWLGIDLEAAYHKKREYNNERYTS